MPTYRFLPLNLLVQASFEKLGTVPMRHGGEYEVSLEWADKVNSIVEGADGQPALSLIDSGTVTPIVDTPPTTRGRPHAKRKPQ